jgi:hypothetical protein
MSCVPLDSVLPSCGDNILLISAFPVLDVLDVDGGFPTLQQSRLLFLIVGIQEYKFVGVEQHRVLESVPPVALELLIVPCQYQVMVLFLLLFLTLHAESSQYACSHII